MIEDSFDEIEDHSGATFDQINSLRSELFNINNRIGRKDELSYHNSRQNSNYKMFESSDNAGGTRPSTNGFLKCELEPIDHERSKMKLKMILEQQLKNATGEKKLEIERKLAEIEHRRFKEQK